MKIYLLLKPYIFILSFIPISLFCVMSLKSYPLVKLSICLPLEKPEVMTRRVKQEKRKQLKGKEKEKKDRPER
jgi:hypothetical protein